MRDRRRLCVDEFTTFLETTACNPLPNSHDPILKLADTDFCELSRVFSTSNGRRATVRLAAFFYGRTTRRGSPRTYSMALSAPNVRSRKLLCCVALSTRCARRLVRLVTILSATGSATRSIS